MIKISNKDLVHAIDLELYFMGKKRLLDDDLFTEEEIDSIKRINLIDVQSIDGVEDLPNLEELNIGNDEYFDYNDENMANSIDFGLISQLPNLKKLIILNTLTLRKLDVSKLDKLENLRIIYNPLLDEIIGMDKLSNLKNVVIIGNNIKNIDNFCELVNNNHSLDKVLLDIWLYPVISKYFNFDNNLKKYVSFAEKISFGEIYTPSHSEMEKVHVKACNIIKNITTSNMDLYTKIVNIYKYVINSLIYNNKGLSDRDEYYITHKYNSFENSEIMNYFRRMNTCIEAMISGCVVCEGYVNMIIYLFNLVGISARSIKVKDKEKESSHYDHVAMCYEYKDEIRFADPQKEDDFVNLNKLGYTFEEFYNLYDIYPMDEHIINTWKDEIYDKNSGHFKKAK